MSNFNFPKSSSLKPVADIDEPIIKEQAGFGAAKKTKPKEEEVIAELEISEDEGAELKEEEKESEQPLEHKVVKYGEYKKEIKRPFGKAES